MNKLFCRAVVVLACGVALSAIGPADAAEEPRAGARWRLEFGAYAGLHTGGADRSGDYYGMATFEYERPLSRHAAVGLRTIPVFIYSQDGRAEDADWIAGIGAGVAARIYANGDTYDGLFGEVIVSALWHNHRFYENASNLNFVSEIGVGYQFTDNEWHVALKAQHISNAGLGEDNDGVNAVGIAVGFTF